MSKAHNHFREPPTKEECKQAWLKAELMWYELSTDERNPLNGTQVSKEPKDVLNRTMGGLNKENGR